MRERFSNNINKDLLKLKKPNLELRHVNIAGSKGRLTPLDTFKTIVSIDWGPNHCVFVDNLGRIFSMGSNFLGKTGLKRTWK